MKISLEIVFVGGRVKLDGLRVSSTRYLHGVGREWQRKENEEVWLSPPEAESVCLVPMSQH